MRTSEWIQQPAVVASRSLLDKDWQVYTETLAHIVLGWSEGQPARRFAELIRESVTPEFIQSAFRAISGWDVSGLLPQVRSPTLVLHRRQHALGVDVARRLVSSIPNARLALLEGDSMAPYLGDTEAVLRAIDDFLGEAEQAAAPAVQPAAGGLVTILFTDIEGSTALTQRLGDAKAREVLREHERITREALEAHGGSEVKTMGDGFMASFGSATKALECAIAIQRAFAEWNAGVGAQHAAPLHVRIGLNAGEPIAEEDDLHGTAVITAARIAAQAQGGEILASNVVRELVAGKGFLFADRGETVLRGFEDPVRVYEVRWGEEA
jgi:class 3 adenylate cyclase